MLWQSIPSSFSSPVLVSLKCMMRLSVLSSERFSSSFFSSERITLRGVRLRKAETLADLSGCHAALVA